MARILILLIVLGVPMAASAKTAHDFSFENLDGSEFSLSQFKGKTLLIVSTASECGFTSQYAGLEELWQTYRASGLVVIAVPSNDFGGQEPGSNQEVREFCTKNYSVTFPIVNKVRVKGKDAHPFYKWAREEKGAFSVPKWNFHKYLVSPDGELVEYFFSTAKPMSEKIQKAVQKNLP